MPKFRQIAIAEQKAKQSGVSRQIVDEYKKYVEELKKGNIGILEFTKTENIDLARKALDQAAEELGKHLRIRRKRGENALQFQLLTRKEWMEKKRKERARASRAGTAAKGR